ncbi:MAG: GDSL-type esterase/lipase family protein [Chitinophagaceae bacterium]
MRFIKNIFLSALATSAIILSSGCSTLYQYRNSTSTPKWAGEIANFEKLDKTEIYAKDAILFTGSSSIRKWTTIREDMAPYPVISRGFGGSKLEDLAFYLDRIVSPHQFRALVIFSGTNNLTGKETDAKPEELLKLAQYIKRKIRSKYPETPVFWIAITPTNARIKAWPQVQEANRLVKKMCETSPNFHFIETADAYLGKDAKPIKELFVDDQIHQNAAGYSIWTKIIKKELDTYLK